jgi:hypothetical protein
MKKIYILLIFFFSVGGLFSQISTAKDLPFRIGANYRIYPGNVTQSEVFIAKSPVDQNILFTSCNTLNFIPFFISEGIYVTADGGSSWQGNDTCMGYPIEFHGGDPGITIDKNGTFIITRLGRSPFTGLYSHFSMDNGQTWSSQNVISTDDLERAALTTDTKPLSPFYGRTYAAWIKFALPFPLMLAFSDDGAQSWSAPEQINHPSNRSAGGDIAIGPGGIVYVCWAGVTDVSPFREIFIGFASSTSGGSEWNITENAFPVNGITGVLSNKANIRVNGLPAIAVDNTEGQKKGWIYIATGQKDLVPAGSDPDIILYRSADGGSTWSEGIRVNQDVLNNGKTQYFPAVHVDKSGAVNVIFYDDRNTTNDSSGVFLARSKDGGETWTEFEISDHHFKPTPIGGLGQGYQGDNIDLTSTDSKLWPVWMDNSTGIYQIWTVPVDYSEVNEISDGNHSCISVLFQNAPNPFYQNTMIRYQISDFSRAVLKVFDYMGREVRTLVDSEKVPGMYFENFDAAGLSPGIYFYQLQVDEMLKTLKMFYSPQQAPGTL